MKPQSKTEATVLGLISAGAVTLVILQLTHNITIDKWVIIVFAIGALPWFWRTLESITFPGGGIKLLRERQDRQEIEIRQLKFLVANFIPAEQRRVLRKFANDGPFEFGAESNRSYVLKAMGELQNGGLLERVRNPPASGQPDLSFDGGHGDLKILFRISPLGREYLEILKDHNE